MKQLNEIKELQRRYDRLHLLYQVSGVIQSTLDPREALRLIVREAVRLMRASSGSVVLINPTSGLLEIEAACGLPENVRAFKFRLGEGITGWVARTGKPARSGDVSRDARYVMVRPGVQSELAVPLEVDGEVRGVLNVDSERRDAFSREDEELFVELARHAAQGIQHTWMHEQFRLKARLFEALVSVGQTINSTFNLDEALRVITREAALLMEVKMCSLLMVDGEGEWLELRASYGAGEPYINKPRLSLAESLMGNVVRRKKPAQIEDVQTSARYQSIAVARREGLVSLLTVPLLYGGEAIGTLNVYTGEPYVFSNEEIRILSALAELSAIAIEKARLYERVMGVEEQLRQREKLSAIGLLAAEVAHEIRNPLTVMKMLFHGLELDFPGEDPRCRDVQMIAGKMEHLNKVVEQVLDLARNTEPKFDAVQVNQLLDDLGLLTRHKLANQKIQLVRKLAPDLPPVHADAAQLEQVFLNLILNAVEAMPHGGRLTLVTRFIRLPPKKSGPGRVVIEFKDTGPGMTGEQRRRVFTSLLSTTKPKGTGLGLAIVGKIIDAHNGEIKILSRPGRGSTVQIFLPLEP